MFPNFIFANELIARDESLHRDYGAYLAAVEISEILSAFTPGSEEYNQKFNQIKEEIAEIIDESIIVEDQFTDHILAQPLEDLNAADLKIYTRLIADNLLVQLSFSAKYNVKNPFTWLNDISMEQKANFYEVRVGAYTKKSLSEVLDWSRRAGLKDNVETVFDNPEEVDF